MSETKIQVPATKVRIATADLNHQGKADTVTIEFYKKGKIYYAVEAVEKYDTGFTQPKSAGYGEIDNKKLIELANLVLHLH
jgi:hypothetical protein